MACSLIMTRAVGTFGKHLKHPARKCRGFLRFQHHSALLQQNANISCTLFLFFGVIKDFTDAGLSGTEPFHSRFVVVNCNRTLASSLTACLFILNYSLRDLSTVSSMPKSSTRRKQGLQTRFECSTYGSSRIQAMLLIRSIRIYISKKLLCLICK